MVGMTEFEQGAETAHSGTKRRGSGCRNNAGVQKQRIGVQKGVQKKHMAVQKDASFITRFMLSVRKPLRSFAWRPGNGKSPV
jgi:hypothetical protein